MHNWDPSVLTRGSIIAKLLVFGYISGTLLYCIVGAIMENIPSNDSDIYEVIIEWNLTLMGLLWLLTFVLDYKNVFLVLRGDFSRTIKKIRF